MNENENEKIEFSNKINNLIKLDNGWYRYFFQDDSKHFLIKKRLDWIVSNVRGKKILDIGCGEGVVCNLLQKLENIEEIFGIDLSEKIITKAIELNKDIKKLKFGIGFGEDLKFEDNYFDTVYHGRSFGAHI